MRKDFAWGRGEGNDFHAVKKVGRKINFFQKEMSMEISAQKLVFLSLNPLCCCQLC